MIDGSIIPTQHIQHPAQVIRVVQITDAHLCEQHGGTLLGMDTDHSLQAVIDLVKREQGAPDLLLLTGDLSDQGSASAYVRMDSYSRQLSNDAFWLPGNHDDRGQMSSAVADSRCLSSEIRVANWQILMLDSQIPGEVGGELGAGQLALLEQRLEQAAQDKLSTLICLHHHLVPIGCDWLDEQMVADAGAFFDIVDCHPGVKGVLCGHVHQQLDEERNGVALMASPSTCVQFAPDSARFKADNLSPGYRWLELQLDGTINSGVSRVEGVHFTVDLESKGYL